MHSTCPLCVDYELDKGMELELELEHELELELELELEPELGGRGVRTPSGRAGLSSQPGVP